MIEKITIERDGRRLEVMLWMDKGDIRLTLYAGSSSVYQVYSYNEVVACLLPGLDGKKMGYDMGNGSGIRWIEVIKRGENQNLLIMNYSIILTDSEVESILALAHQVEPTHEALMKKHGIDIPAYRIVSG